MEYLGRIISEQRVSTDVAKRDAMRQWPTPKSVKQLRGFLDLTETITVGLFAIMVSL